MKIRIVLKLEYDADDMADWLKQSGATSGKSIAAICREAKITTQFWYELTNNKKEALRFDTLKKIESAVGKTYSANWREEWLDELF